jgi:YD repeat-containing protein
MRQKSFYLNSDRDIVDRKDATLIMRVTYDTRGNIVEESFCIPVKREA